MHKVITDVMIDLETMGLGPTAAIMQVAAVPFNLESRSIYEADTLLRDVDLQTTLMHGATITKSTAEWWKNQGGLKLENPRPIGDVMLDLDCWFRINRGIKRVWAQGPDFDIAILNWYQQKLEFKEPIWKFWEARDTRTFYDVAKMLNPDWRKPKGTKATHRADEDCIAQIKCVFSAMDEIDKALSTN